MWPLSGSRLVSPKGLAAPLRPALDVQPRPSRPLSQCTSHPTSSSQASKGLRQTRTLTARPPGPGSGSIRPQTENKEEARGSLRYPREAHAAPERTCSPQGVVPQPRVCGYSLTRASPYAVGALQVTLLAHYRLFCAHRDKGVGGSARVPPPGPGLYLHVTQLHAQIQLAVSLSPVDVRRQHLILHDHTAQGAGRLGSLRLAASSSAQLEPAKRRPQNPRAPACRQPAATRQPTLACRACAMTSGSSKEGSGIWRKLGESWAKRRRKGAGPGACDATSTCGNLRSWRSAGAPPFSLFFRAVLTNKLKSKKLISMEKRFGAAVYGKSLSFYHSLISIY